MEWIIIILLIGALIWLINIIGLGCFAAIILYGWGIIRLIKIVHDRKEVKRIRQKYRNLMLQKEENFKRLLQNLMIKYNDMHIVYNIVHGKYWQGQTAEQLLDAIGEPEDIDPEVIKDKRREIWKYNKQGKGRYGFRVILEDGIVIGWRGTRVSEDDDD